MTTPDSPVSDPTDRSGRAVAALLAQGRLGQPHRDDDRVVRLLHLRHGRGAGVQRGLLPVVRPGDRDPGRVRLVLRRVHRAALRRRGLRPLRRPDRPQADAGVLAAAHGRGDGAHGPAARLRLDRHLGADHAGPPAVRPGLRRRRRVGRRGADGRGARTGPPARLLRRLAPGGRTGRPRPRHGAFAVLSATLSDEQFLAWGWRIPFLASALLIAVGLWIRLTVAESPIFQETLDAKVGREDAGARRAQDLPEGDRAGRRVVRGHARHVLRRLGLADLLRDARSWATTAPRSSTRTRH